MLIVLSPDCLGKFSVSLERWWIISLHETHRSGQWTGNPRDGGANECSSLLQSHLQLIEFIFPRRQIKTSGPWEGNYHSNIPHGNTLTRQIRGRGREDRDVKKGREGLREKMSERDRDEKREMRHFRQFMGVSVSTVRFMLSVKRGREEGKI